MVFIISQQLLGKRKREEPSHDFDECNTIYGIVTTGRVWQFVRWTGTPDKPRVEVSREYNVAFEGDMEQPKRVLSFIVRLLQSQAKMMKSEVENTKDESSDEDQRSSRRL